MTLPDKHLPAAFIALRTAAERLSCECWANDCAETKSCSQPESLASLLALHLPKFIAGERACGDFHALGESTDSQDFRSEQLHFRREAKAATLLQAAKDLLCIGGVPLFQRTRLQSVTLSV